MYPWITGFLLQLGYYHRFIALCLHLVFVSVTQRQSVIFFLIFLTNKIAVISLFSSISEFDLWILICFCLSEFDVCVHACNFLVSLTLYFLWCMCTFVCVQLSSFLLLYISYAYVLILVTSCVKKQSVIVSSNSILMHAYIYIVETISTHWT